MVFAIKPNVPICSLIHEFKSLLLLKTDMNRCKFFLVVRKDLQTGNATGKTAMAAVAFYYSLQLRHFHYSSRVT